MVVVVNALSLHCLMQHHGSLQENAIDIFIMSHAAIVEMQNHAWAESEQILARKGLERPVGCVCQQSSMHNMVYSEYVVRMPSVSTSTS